MDTTKEIISFTFVQLFGLIWFFVVFISSLICVSRYKLRPSLRISKLALQKLQPQDFGQKFISFLPPKEKSKRYSALVLAIFFLIVIIFAFIAISAFAKDAEGINNALPLIIVFFFPITYAITYISLLIYMIWRDLKSQIVITNQELSIIRGDKKEIINASDIDKVQIDEVLDIGFRSLTADNKMKVGLNRVLPIYMQKGLVIQTKSSKIFFIPIYLIANLNVFSAYIQKIAPQAVFDTSEFESIDFFTGGLPSIGPKLSPMIFYGIIFGIVVILIAAMAIYTFYFGPAS